MSMTREEAIEIFEQKGWWIAQKETLTSKQAEEIIKLNNAVNFALSALHPVSRGQIEQNKRRWEVQTSIFPYYYCSGCGESFEIHSYDKEKYRFCPYCMSPMTDEAVDMVMERLEALKDDC